VNAPVVDDLKPGREQPVELGELDAVVDLDQELIGAPSDSVVSVIGAAGS
jgi:hypothetical protein